MTNETTNENHWDRTKAALYGADVRVLQTADGTPVVPQPDPTVPSAVWMSRHRAETGHRIAWGPACRVMLRVPRGQERVTILCRTCGLRFERVAHD